MIVRAKIKRYESDSGVVFPHKKGDISEINLVDFDTCCQEMETAFDEHFIGFGEYEGFLNKIDKVCIYQCSPYPEGACWDEMEIKVCPFCGEQINLDING